MKNDDPEVKPVRAVPGAIAVVTKGEQLLLVRRSNPPDSGRWGFPGGKIEAGETIMDAAIRELREETGVAATAERVLTAVDVLDRDDAGGLRHHFVLIAVLCRWTAGEPVAADDIEDARWLTPTELERTDLALSHGVREVARQAMAHAGTDDS